MMTKFQALYVLWLRNENFQGCSWRMLARKYSERYGEILGKVPRLPYNQLDGMLLEEEAWKVLKPNPLFMETPDLFENDLILINTNLSRHLKLLNNE